MKLTRTMTLVALLAMASTGLAYPVDVYSENGPQDPLFIQGPVHELGEIVFPPGEEIYSSWTYTDQTSCYDGSDNPGIRNILVMMTNLTSTSWYDLHYVADPGTTISNYDGWIGNSGYSDACLAFKIDDSGINQPRVLETANPFDAFDPGETWQFIIQDFQGPDVATPFDSLGIASMSGPGSTGSIIAVPEPATLGLLLLGGLALLRRRW